MTSSFWLKVASLVQSSGEDVESDRPYAELWYETGAMCVDLV